MKFAVTGIWKKGFQHDGMLYCVQRMEEMLYGYTSHIYKVPVLNSFLLGYEQLSVSNDVDQGIIDPVYLNLIMEELKCRLIRGDL